MIGEDASRLWDWMRSSERYVQKFQTQSITAMRELVEAGLVREIGEAGHIIEVELTPAGEVERDR